MKNRFKRISALALALLLAFILTATASAAETTLTFKSQKDGFSAQPGSPYTATDLFDGFKNVMPGDRLTQSIRLKNEATDCDSIKLYLRVLPHNEAANPLTYDEPYENADGKDQTSITGERDETVATMQDFLSRLTLRIYSGSEKIYESTPDQAGALAQYVCLGSLRAGEALSLRVELDVPLELDNRYANRVGEVDWVFLAECIDSTRLTVCKVWEDNGYPARPSSVRVSLLRDGQAQETVELNAANQWTHVWDELDDRYTWTVEEEPVAGYTTRYRTEDNTVFITNHRDYSPGPYPDWSRDLTVRKVWSDEGNRGGNRPDSVSVTLHKDGQPMEKVILSAQNGWTYTWKDLDSHFTWSVLETGIPKGYTPVYRVMDGVTEIVNTATLIQTGQLNWPIPVLCGAGLLLIALGVAAGIRKKKEHD